MIKRNISAVLEELNNRYPVLILTGLSGAGKKALLVELESTDRTEISLADKELRKLAEENPAEFVKHLKPPVLISEVQYGLNLMPYINHYASKNKKTGQFWLVGTHMCDLFDEEGASLGENIGIAKLLGLTYDEIMGVDMDLYDIKVFERNTIKNHIMRGSMPALYEDGLFRNKEQYFDEIIQEFLRTEVKFMAKANSIIQFRKFMSVVAKRSGELVNFANFAKDAAISQPTAKQWFSILIEGGIVGIVKAYRHESLKRIVDVPRFFFMDTGICAYMSGIKKPEKLFKTWAVTEILKKYYNMGIIPPVSHYRDKDGKEVDLIIEDGGMVHPIKIDGYKEPYEPDKHYYNGFLKKGISIAPWKTISLKKK